MPDVKIKKDGQEYGIGVIPQHYPADRVYLDGDKTKDAESAIDGKVSKSGDTMTGALVIERDNEIQFAARRKNTGTTSLPTTVQIGNNIADGTEGCTSGRLRIYGIGSYRTDLGASSSTANRSISLPDKSGTVALTDDIPTISFNGTLGSGQNVLTVAKNMPNNSIAYYKNSNKPTNRPTDGDYGAYEFIKSDNMTMIKYIAGNMTACAYGIDSSATSITWHIS